VKRLAPAVVLLALAGCSGASLPAPTIVSVDPAQRPASSSGPVTVTLDAILPTAVDYGAGSATVDDALSLKIGGRPFGTSHWVDGGVITDFLPSVLPEGRYDVTVQLGDGRLAIATDGFRVTPGNWPIGYIINTIPSQHSGIPFGVSITAEGADGGFSGTVTLTVSSGAHVSPTISGPFVAGTLNQVITVTVDDPRNDPFSLTVTDLDGHFGTSLPFHVR
jgi:hypothetical protein